MSDKWQIIEVKLTIRGNFNENETDESIAQQVAEAAQDGFGYPLGADFKSELLSRIDEITPPVMGYN